MATVTNSHAFTVRIAPEQAGLRLDRTLADALPEISRSRLKALIEDGCVSADGQAVRVPSARVRGGQDWVVVVPEAAPAEPEPQAIDLVVVFEDDDVIVIDKPAGMVVHPAPGNPDGTLVNALLAHCGGELAGIGGVRRPGIVHRLDKDTSGLMVAAKNDTAHQGLAAQFATHTIERAYKAVIWGVPHPAHGTVEGQIGRSPADRKKMAVVSGGGKFARTHYALERAFGRGASLIDCRLETGRTHQIRVHMTSIGHPLVGDPVYGRPRATAKDRTAAGLPQEAIARLRAFPRQALHAYLIGFRHPRSGRAMRFVGAIASDINDLYVWLEAP